MVEALWSAEFRLPNGSNFGAGIVVLETGRLLGGDSSFTYIGEYSIKDGQVSGFIRARKFSHSINLPSISGLDDSVIEISGMVGNQTMTLTGKIKALPGFTLEVSLTRRAELP